MAEQSVAAPAAYQLDPLARERILAESPRAETMRLIEQQRQAFMAMHDGCPFGMALAGQVQRDQATRGRHDQPDVPAALDAP